MMLQPRLIALETEAQNVLTLDQVESMLLELSYMERNERTTAIVDTLLDRRIALSRSAVAA